jgi:hypothetical protein
MNMPLMLKKTIIASTWDLLILAFLVLSEVGVFQCYWFFSSVPSFFSSTRNFIFTHRFIYILVTNPAEQHNMVTLKAQG